MLIKCDECEHQVSDKATACPNCGAPIAQVNISDTLEQQVDNKNSSGVISSSNVKKSNYTNLIITSILIIAVAVIIFIVLGIQNNFWQEKEKSSDEFEEATADFIVSEYLKAIIANNDYDVYCKKLYFLSSTGRLGFIDSMDIYKDALASFSLIEQYVIDDFSVLKQHLILSKS